MTNGDVRDENYKGNLLFTMKDFVSFVTYSKSMYFMSTLLLKYNIGGISVPQFKIYYIYDTTHTSHTNLVKLCCEVHYT